MGTVITCSLAVLIVFYAVNKSMKNRRINSCNRFREKQDELLSILREKTNSIPTDERSDATEAP